MASNNTVGHHPSSASRPSRKRRQGGLRPAIATAAMDESLEVPRQMQISAGNFPKRAKLKPDGVFLPRESSLGKFIIGVWEQIHSGLILEPHVLTEQLQLTADASAHTNSTNEVGISTDLSTASLSTASLSEGSFDMFTRGNVFCQRVTQASRTCRSIEVIVQARWIELFDSYVQHLTTGSPGISPTRARMKALAEACSDFGWSEKELRNKMAIWRGYKEIKDVLGWGALVFSGMGLYRLCKYRIDFDKDKFGRARALRGRMEVAADTLHRNWRQLLAIVGEPTEQRFTGHPHDWVVYQDGSDPVPLRSTYLQYDPNFSFEHVDECVVDTTWWGADDPRWMPPASRSRSITNKNTCVLCDQVQSGDAVYNSCKCFSSLFSGPRLPPAVQIFRTSDGRNNGLQALVPFERGVAIGEFTGLVTKGIKDQDVLDSKVGDTRYQIWQGRQGNFTRFVNHSCKPNAQFEKFTWLGTEHILLVSNGIEAGMEITVDYSGSYWRGLDKNCLCGEVCCRYKASDET
ncbi:related to SET domain-containing protein SNOG_11806 [Fusarium mangiferae]|uniref:Related to SET domain-containing protein SNOG_11806 n=1 Tax=Fusarium mangiferae TaxID=192010 RepID=A0A1L7SEV8_FUSMA|nr:related to SET domain-containing protein SNOG_11806 [Fusarium mangiferae]CVK85071.1 related to SET domain-containing protein SNOG_11806 [Fusarium mangiferae]